MLLILAQARGRDADLSGAVSALFCLFAIFVLCGIILFFLTLQNVLSNCKPRNRTMEPTWVWYNFMPLLNIVWQFITINRVAESLENEFNDRGWHRRDDDYGRQLGMIAIWLHLAWVVAGCIAGFARVNDKVAILFVVLSNLTVIVLGTIYWVIIAGYNRRLTSRYKRFANDESDDDYDHDDRARTPRNRGSW